MSQNWELEDVEEAHLQSPDSFFVPSADERSALKPRTLVRLHFLVLNDGSNRPRAERMWVQIAERSLDGRRYVGVLTNQPRFIRSLNQGDSVTFGPQHVAQVLIERGDPRRSDVFEKSAFVSLAALAKGAAVRWLYRELPDREQNSGWRLFAGDETDDYVNDAKNLKICNVGWLVDRDPSLDEVVRSDVGSAFERAGAEDQWRAVTDFEPPKE